MPFVLKNSNAMSDTTLIMHERLSYILLIFIFDATPYSMLHGALFLMSAYISVYACLFLRVTIIQYYLV